MYEVPAPSTKTSMTLEDRNFSRLGRAALEFRDKTGQPTSTSYLVNRIVSEADLDALVKAMSKEVASK